MLRVAKISALAIAVGFAMPAFADPATPSNDGANEASNKSSSADSEFERTRQHMIEKNRESQRTGQM